jgi:Polyketide cyclase / dehydrase and lipid transport
MTKATGATVEVEILVDKDLGQMWDLVTDVARIGEWSPECVGGAWLEGATGQAGSRFKGYNRFSAGFTATTTCVVTEARCPDVFEWVVLDPSAQPEHPGSIWRYELAAGERPGQTKVVHRFVHGPGLTGLSEAMRNDPPRAEAILKERIEKLREHMTVTIEAMARD